MRITNILNEKITSRNNVSYSSSERIISEISRIINPERIETGNVRLPRAIIFEKISPPPAKARRTIKTISMQRLKCLRRTTLARSRRSRRMSVINPVATTMPKRISTSNDNVTKPGIKSSISYKIKNHRRDTLKISGMIAFVILQTCRTIGLMLISLLVNPIFRSSKVLLKN